MHRVFPLAEIEAKFDKPVECSQFNLQQYSEIVRLKPDIVTGLALNVWNRIVHNPAFSVDPMALKRFASFPKGEIPPEFNPRIISGIESVIGKPVIREVSYSCCVIQGDEEADTETVAELFLAHVFPNDLHIADMHFRNPFRPIPLEKRLFRYQMFEGLGLLGTVILNVDAYAQSKACDFVTLTAAHDDLVPLFSRYGFSVEENEPGKLARAMEKPSC